MAAVPVSLILLSFIPKVVGKVGGGSQQGPQVVHQPARSGSVELQDAFDAMLGCGGDADSDSEHLLATEEALRPIWRALSKDDSGKVEWQSLRYMAHRYFMHRFGLTVRGFEPARLVNASGGHADVLTKHVPHFVEILLEQRQAGRGFLRDRANTVRGFSLADAVGLVVTIERLIFDSETHLLEEAYGDFKLTSQSRLGRNQLTEALEMYVIRWIVGDDKESVENALKNPKSLHDTFPHWDAIRKFLSGQIRALDFTRHRAPHPLSARSAFSGTYSFDDAHAVVGSITRSFASFWESECRAMKDSLVDMDESGTGRVPLSKFYGSALSDEARFGESEAYLRDLGVLDESSAWRKKEVRIANYMQAASNCIVSAPNYLVCCKNECEEILGEVEIAIGAPSAPPRDVLRVVRTIYSPSSENDKPPALKGALTNQLEKLGALHGGMVPLHGRLFAQWLHYAYPRECAFPHKAGTHKTQTPSEYGEKYVATDAEMRMHASTATSEKKAHVTSDSSTDEEEEEEEEESWTSQQWSDEDEVLLATSSAPLLRAPWESHQTCATTGGALAAFLLAAWLATTWRSGKNDSTLLPTSTRDAFAKSHLV
jgi:hypothetical protein